MIPFQLEYGKSASPDEDEAVEGVVVEKEKRANKKWGQRHGTTRITSPPHAFSRTVTTLGLGLVWGGPPLVEMRRAEILAGNAREDTGYAARKQYLVYRHQTEKQRELEAKDALADDDPLRLVPGLETTEDDIRALEERELAPGTPRPVTRKDPLALARIERARERFAVRAVKITGEGPTLEGFVAGDGRVCLKRTLSSGLEELVLASTDEITNVYPELGLASRRPRSSHNQDRIDELAPFLLPPASIVASMNVSVRGDSGVMLTQPSASGDGPVYRIELDFDPSGLLKESRVVREGDQAVVRRVALAPDGTVTIEREACATRRLSVTLSAPTGPPSFEARLEGMFVVDMPTRTSAFARARFLAAPEGKRQHLLDQLVFSQLLEGTTIEFGLDGHASEDHRLGLSIVLASWSGVPRAHLNAAVHAHPESAILEVLVLAKAVDSDDKIERSGALALETRSGLAPTLARYVAAKTALRLASQQPQDAPLRKRALSAAQEFADHSRCGTLTLLLARTAASLSVNYQDDTAPVRRIYDRVSGPSDLVFRARHEGATFLLMHGNQNEAASLFEDAYEIAMAAGEFPTLDGNVVRALLEARRGDENALDAFLERGLSWATRARSALALASVAKAGAHSGKPAVVWRALRSLPLTLAPDGVRAIETVAIDRILSGADPAQASALLGELLARPSLAGSSTLHRCLGLLAAERGRYALATAELEQALAIAGHDSHTRDDLRAMNADLMECFSGLASATGSQELAEPILRAVERARRISPEDDALMQKAASALLACGATEVAWEVATTTIARHPREGEAYRIVSQTYRSSADLALAARILAWGAACEPQDPTFLLEEAELQEQLGQTAAARSLRQRISTGRWHERFSGVVTRARQALGP